MGEEHAMMLTEMDIIIAVDATGSMRISVDPNNSNFINSYCSQSQYFINKLITSMNRANVDWKICLVDYQQYIENSENLTARTVYTNPKGDVWFTKGSDIIEAYNNIIAKVKTAKETRQTPWDALGYATEEIIFRVDAERHSILLTDQAYENANRYSIKDINDMTSRFKADNIKLHQVMDVFVLNDYRILRQTGGVFGAFSANFILDFPQYIVDKIIDIQNTPEPEPSDNVTVVTSFGLESIDPATILGDNLLNDLDKDGLNNKSEINTDALEKFNPGKELTAKNLITLQQFSEAIDKSTIDRFSDGILAKYKDIKVLPLKSDPRKADSDGDGFMDSEAIAEQSKGYYKIADKWAMNSKPKPEFYQKDGNYYFNKIIFPKTNVGNYPNGYGPQTLNITPDIQKYIYDLCEVANTNESLLNTDPLLIMSICAHESNSQMVKPNQWGYTGYMQLYPGHIQAYCNKSMYYNNNAGRRVSDIINKMLSENKLSIPDFNLLSNKATSTVTIQEIIADPYVNFTFRIAKLHECIREKGDKWNGLRYYCSFKDTHSPIEDYFYRNTLAFLIGEEFEYEDKYANNDFKYTVNIISNLDK